MYDIRKKVWNLVEGIAERILKGLFRCAKREMTDEMFGTCMQFIKFGIVGFSNTVISYFCYAGSLGLFRQFQLFSKLDYMIASVIGFLLSVLWSFYWNNKVVFRLMEGQMRSWWKSLVKTYIAYSFSGLFLSSILLVLWVQVCHISEWAAPILNLLLSVPINFLMNKFWAFRNY